MTLLSDRLRLYLVTDQALAAGRPLVEIVLAAVAGGVTMVQLREKRAGTRQFIEQARAVQAALAGRGIPLIVNDRVDVALAVGADGVHLGEDDMPCVEARRIMGPAAIIGQSLTSVFAAAAPEADYIGAGPIFATATKPDADPPMGLSGLAELRQRLSRPVVAIGGIDQGNARRIIEAGADGISVVSAIVAAADPEAAAARLKMLVDDAVLSRPRR